MTTAATPGREELAIEVMNVRRRIHGLDDLDLATLQRIKRDAGINEALAIADALLARLAAKPADEPDNGLLDIYRQNLIEECAKIAEPWPGFSLDENSTDVDRAVVAVRTEIAKTIRGLAQPTRDGAEGAAQANLQEAWLALGMIREAIEKLGPVGALPASEHLAGPTFTHEAEALVDGIRKIAAAPPKPAPDAIRSLATDEQAAIVSALRSVPVPPADYGPTDDGYRRVAPVPPADEVQQQRTAMMLARSGAGAAEPVASISAKQAMAVGINIAEKHKAAVLEILSLTTNGKTPSWATFEKALHGNLVWLASEIMVALQVATPVRGDREALIHAICSHIRQWADSEEVTDFACKECPAKVETSQGAGTQLCRINAEKAADAILSLPVQSTAHPDREAAAQVIAKRMFGGRLEDLESLTRDNCRDTVTEIFELAGAQSGAGERDALLKYLDIFLHPNPQVDLSGLVCKHGLAIEACAARECSNPMAYETAISRARDYISRQAPHSSSGTGE